MNRKKRAPLVVGACMTVRGKRCTIVKVHPFGTVDAVAIDGSGAYRVTGLWP